MSGPPHRSVWLDLGWLIVLVLTLALPLALHQAGRLTYAWSLSLWIVPILYLTPLFLRVTADGTGRRRTALAASVATIVVLGVVLDFWLGPRALIFPGCEGVAGASSYLWCVNGRVPIEELIFYATGPAAMVLVYAAADERWLSAYNPPDDLVAARLVQVSRPLLAAAAGAGAAVTFFWYRNGTFPIYLAFLSACALLPAVFLYRCVGSLVNWPAFAVTTLYVAVTSIVWEVTLAIPAGWWGYRGDAMIGVIGAWSAPGAAFPVEAALVWIAAPFSAVLTYEFAKAFTHHPAPTTRARLLGPAANAKAPRPAPPGTARPPSRRGERNGSKRTGERE